MKFCFLPLYCAVGLLAACSSRMSLSPTATLVPKPLVEECAPEGVFDLSRESVISLASEDSSLRFSADFFNSLVSKSFGGELEIRVNSLLEQDAINVRLNDSLQREEYRMQITPDGIMIEGGSPAGVFYAFQSLRQLLPPAALAGKRASVIELPLVRISDKPSFAYRGTMLDVGRHFFSVEDVKSYIDLLAMHKINHLHWHLTDDQGWRIEIKRYPLLTEIGSIRPRNLLNHSMDSVHHYDEHPYGGFYSQDQVREIVRYAAQRFITVIPEIEMPGHATAALAAYPELGCRGKDYTVSSMWGVHTETFCAGKDTTFGFLEGVLTEVMDLFPSEYIHIGGDECMKDRWNACPLCQQRMHKMGLKSPEALQSYFMQRIEKFVASHGRRIIGWDEILEGGISQSATVMSWRGTEGGIRAAKLGNHVIMAPYTYCYLDYYQSLDRKTEPLTIRGYLPPQNVYSLDPYAGLSPEEQPYILGVQANLWSEYISDLPQLQYMSLPRLAAVAEVGWSYGNGAKDYADFHKRMQAMRKVYDAAGYRYAKHMFAPGAENEPLRENPVAPEYEPGDAPFPSPAIPL